MATARIPATTLGVLLNWALQKCCLPDSWHVRCEIEFLNQNYLNDSSLLHMSWQIPGTTPDLPIISQRLQISWYMLNEFRSLPTNILQMMYNCLGQPLVTTRPGTYQQIRMCQVSGRQHICKVLATQRFTLQGVDS